MVGATEPIDARGSAKLSASARQLNWLAPVFENSAIATQQSWFVLMLRRLLMTLPIGTGGGRTDVTINAQMRIGDERLAQQSEQRQEDQPVMKKASHARIVMSEAALAWFCGSAPRLVKNH